MAMASYAVVRAGIIGTAVMTEANRGQIVKQAVTKFKVSCFIKVLDLD